MILICFAVDSPDSLDNVQAKVSYLFLVFYFSIIGSLPVSFSLGGHVDLIWLGLS